MTITVEDVEKIYQAYPLKVGKRTALKSIERALKRLVEKKEYKNKNLSESEAIAGLLNRTIMFAQSPKAKSDFVPHPSTFYNQGRYLDDPKTWDRNQKPVNRAVERDDRVKDTINRVLGGSGRARAAAVGGTEAGGPERSRDRVLGEGTGRLRTEND